MMAEATLRRVARWLRREFPVSAGLGRIRLLPLNDGYYGFTTPGGTIQLNRDYSRHLQLETLLHEWSHLRVGWKNIDHSQEFWKELGRITNAYHQWREEESDEE